jgi:hypothetical protein
MNLHWISGAVFALAVAMLLVVNWPFIKPLSISADLGNLAVGLGTLVLGLASFKSISENQKNYRRELRKGLIIELSNDISEYCTQIERFLLERISYETAAASKDSSADFLMKELKLISIVHEALNMRRFRIAMRIDNIFKEDRDFEIAMNGAYQFVQNVKFNVSAEEPLRYPDEMTQLVNLGRKVISRLESSI